jgi:hypothetical protein
MERVELGRELLDDFDGYAYHAPHRHRRGSAPRPAVPAARGELRESAAVGLTRYGV